MKEVIATLPNVLIVRLNRIRHEIAQNRQTKLNTYFEFPKTIDLKRYTYDEQIKDDDKATLAEQKSADYERIKFLKQKLIDDTDMPKEEMKELKDLISEFGEMYNPKPD